MNQNSHNINNLLVQWEWAWEQKWVPLIWINTLTKHTTKNVCDDSKATMNKSQCVGDVYKKNEAFRWILFDTKPWLFYREKNGVYKNTFIFTRRSESTTNAKKGNKIPNKNLHSHKQTWQIHVWIRSSSSALYIDATVQFINFEIPIRSTIKPINEINVRQYCNALPLDSLRMRIWTTKRQSEWVSE